MYSRLSDSYRKLFADDALPSLVLAHGKTALHAGFSSTILPTSATQDQGRERFGDESGAACAAWIADSRRKAFLAHVGVGTIDQALLGVLPSKFQALRLWGLADRVLIIDEAHAYDAYMGREIETLLEFHAALGGSAIILSATLPGAQRRALIAAYSRGLGQPGATPDQAAEAAYPLVTMISRHGADPHPVGTREDRKRTLQVRRIGSLDDAIAHVQAMTAKGACVAWIRNAVDDAIEAVQALEAIGLKPVLLHARFAMGDRLDIERRVTETLGRQGSAGRKGFVLVGTQILEQSLDYDVDAMIIDLAPIDLMIQRAGRLWRHTDHDNNRPATAPELLVYAPDPAVVTDRDWYRQISARAAAVYDHHGIVWRSARVLFCTGHISTPDGVRGLIERVYAPLDFDDIPEPLLRQSQLAHGTRGGQRHFANTNVLKLNDGYAGAGNLQNWQPDTVAPTRLSQPTTVFRLGQVKDGRIVPLCESEGGDLRLSWALSEVSIAQKKADSVPAPTGRHTAMVAAAQAGWSPWQRDDQPLLVLERDGDGWRGTAAKTGAKIGDSDRPVRYDNRLGFRIVGA
jgi:CRISPR-associated endonuclease/helicase Cas3